MQNHDAMILNVGNPQCAVLVDRLRFRLARAGGAASSATRAFRIAPTYLLSASGRPHLDVRFFERGAGETMSSGTGSTGAAAAAVARGLVRSPVEVRTPAGPLQLRWRDDDILSWPDRRRSSRPASFTSSHKLKEDGLNYAEQLREKIKNHTRRRWASSGWATSACRWPSSSRAPDFTSPESTSTPSKVAALNRGESYIQDIPTATLEAAGRIRQAQRHHRFRRGRANWTPSTSACPRRCARPKIRT